MEIKADGVMDGTLVPRPVKERKKHDRFNGMSEEEVSRRTLPDHLAENLDIIIVSMINVVSCLYTFAINCLSSLAVASMVVHEIRFLQAKHKHIISRDIEHFH